MFGNKGYVGKKYSVRASDAYDEGKKPLGKIRKIDIEYLDLKYKVSVEFFKELTKKFGGSEWHHTSSFYNKTNFYDLEIVRDEINELSLEEFESLKNEFLEQKKELKLEKEKGKIEYKWVYARWTEFERKGRKYKEKNYAQYGILTNGWIFIADYGSKNPYGNNISYSIIDQKDVKLALAVQRYILNAKGIKDYKLKESPANKGLPDYYEVISSEEKYEKEKLEAKIKKEKELEEKDKVDFSKIKRKNLIKKIERVEAGIEIFKDKSLERVSSVHEGKKLLEVAEKIMYEIENIKWYDKVKERQDRAKELGFSYYAEDFIFDDNKRINAKESKKIFLDKEKNALNEGKTNHDIKSKEDAKAK